MVRPEEAEALAVRALDWVLDTARDDGDGLAWPAKPSDTEPEPTLYGGTAGIVVALLEAHRHFGEDRYADAALRGARTLAVAVEDWEHCSLYFGLAGIAFALHAVHEALDDDPAGVAARRALSLVRQRFDGTRWSDQFELLGGNAGIALAALHCGDVELARLAVEPYPRTAEPTRAGVQWENRTGTVARLHHLSHGTLGVVYALTAVGRATGRSDLTDLALAGAADVVSRNEDGPDGFLVPHSDPPHRPDLVERFSYGWCHGPAGDAQVFRLLGGPDFRTFVDRCWHTVTRSGVPRRLRPGFWDNSGRCCGTAGVLALACDRIVEQGDGHAFADVLVTDLAARSTVDGTGARWSNYEHRVTPSDLEPRIGWAMGNAGIVRELLRWVRVTTGRDPGYPVAWPDQPIASPVGELPPPRS